MENKKNSLSMANFKNPNTGVLVDPSMLSDEEKLDFYLACAMNEVIQILEVSVAPDRIFNRAKFSVMKIFHETRDKLL